MATLAMTHRSKRVQHKADLHTRNSKSRRTLLRWRQILAVVATAATLMYQAFENNNIIILFAPQIFPIFLPHFRLYEVVSLHRCVLAYKYPYAQGCDLS